MMPRFAIEFLNRLRYLFSKRRREAELREEMAVHLAMLADDTDPATAKRRLGNATRWQEISREIWGWVWLESLARDIVYGARLLLRSPGFTAVACLSLAIGLGAAMGIFSLLNALLFKALPVPQPEQLWQLVHNASDSDYGNFSYPLFNALQKANSSGIPLFAIGGDYVHVNYGTETRNTPALIVSGDTFRILKLKAYLGRLLTPADDKRGLPRGANCVLSYRLWQSQFHGDPAVIGKHITIGVQSFTIVGVAPRDFFGLYVGAYSDLILPMAGYGSINPVQSILQRGGTTWLNIMARVPPGVPVRKLIADLNRIYPSLLRQIDPTFKPGQHSLHVRSAATGLSVMRSRFAKPLYILLTMTGLVLLIACANLANLLLARSVVRQREMAIRLSVGAHRGRILRQLLTESALIGILGFCASIPIYFACTAGLVTFLKSGFDSDVFFNTGIDWRFVAAVAALLFLTVLLFGLAPALRAMRSDVNSALSNTSRRVAPKTSFGKLVVVIQIVLSLVLLLGAALLSKSLFDLRTFNPGFRRSHLLIAEIDTSQTIHKNAAVAQFFRRVVEQARAVPGVRDAAASVVVPLGGTAWQQGYKIPGATGSRSYHSFENWVAPEYFETMGTPLLLGRDFDAGDSAKAVHVALVNQTFAAQAFGSSNPIGRQIYEKGKKDRLTIVGVVADARYRTLRANAPPTLYRPIAQLPPSFSFLLTLNLEVWTSSPAIDLRSPIQKLVHHLDSEAPVDFRTFDSLIDSDLLYQRLLAALSVGFGLIGLFLSALGVYGLSAYSVARRTSEFGIRMALGATPENIFKMVLSEQIRLLAIALPAGLLISLALARSLRAWLFGVTATDPALYAVAMFVVSVIALFAAFLPARRASRLNPLAALRCE